MIETNARKIKGMEIAARKMLTLTPKGWIVPSQSGNGSYEVSFNGHEPMCNCPDCEVRRVKCKHIWAVEYYMSQEIDNQGRRVTTEAVRMTYSQDWVAYDKAQTHEGRLFMELLSDLCAGIPNKPYAFGRPTMPISDMVFASTLKVYSTFSLRRFVSDMAMANEKGYIDKVVHYSTVARYMEKEELTPILTELIKESSKALASVEDKFAVDSSGFRLWCGI